MISIAYVNNEHEQLLMTDPFIMCESAIEKIAHDSDEYIENFIDKYNQFTVESAIMGEVDDSTIVTESKNVFEAIGEAIIAIFNKFKELIKKVAENLSSIGFKNKSDLEKMDALVKAHPELSKEIVSKFHSGELALSDARSLKEVEAAYDEILKAAKDSKIDPKSFRGKVEAFKKKMKEADKSAIVKGAAAVGAVAGAGTAVLVFRKNLKEVQKENDEEVLRLNKMSEKTLETFKAMDMADEKGHKRTDDLDTSAGKAGILKQLYEEMTVASINKTKKNNDTITKWADGIHAFLLKHDKSGKMAAKDQAKADAKDKEGKEFIKAMRTAVGSKELASKKSAEAQATAQATAQGEYQDKNAAKIRKRNQNAAIGTAAGQNIGNQNYYDNNSDKVLDRKEKEAAATKRGQNSATPAGKSDEKKAYDAAIGTHKAQEDIANGKVKLKGKNEKGNNRPKD